MDLKKLWLIIADLFNKTALGLGVLLGVYQVTTQNYLSAILIFGVFIPLYFYLHDRFGVDKTKRQLLKEFFKTGN